MSAGNHDSARAGSGADDRHALLVAGRYSLERPLARGSQLTTWAAIDHSERDRPAVLVRLFRQRGDAADVRERELDGQIAARHGRRIRGLPDLVELGWEDARRFVVFELPRGEVLAAIPQERLASLPREDRLALAHTLVTAVHALHEAGFLHLDLSPESVVVDLDQRTLHLRDWGYMAPIHRPAATVPAPSDLAGAPNAYASAELLAGATIDPRDDLYAAACLAYQIIAGAHPYRGRPAQKAAALGWRPQPLRALNSHQHALLMKALAFERSSRVVRLDELAAALGNEESGSRESMLSSVTGLRGSRAALFAALVAGVTWFGWQATSLMTARQQTHIAASTPTRAGDRSGLPDAIRPLRRAGHLAPDAIAADLNERIFAVPRGSTPVRLPTATVDPAVVRMTDRSGRDPS